MGHISNQTQINFTGIPGWTYELQRSSDLQLWSTLQESIMPESLEVSYADTTAPAAGAFYQVRPK